VSGKQKEIAKKNGIDMSTCVTVGDATQMLKDNLSQNTDDKPDWKTRPPSTAQLNMLKDKGASSDVRLPNN